jgi:hypothetical protein
MENTLTIKQKKFIKYYIELGNITRAALKAGYKQGQSGFENLEKPLVAAAFQALLDREGLSDHAITKALKRGLTATKYISCNIYVDKKGEMKGADGSTNDFIEVPDIPTQLRAVDILLKMKPHLILHEDKQNEGGARVETFLIETLKNRQKEMSNGEGFRLTHIEHRELDEFIQK